MTEKVITHTGKLEKAQLDNQSNMMGGAGFQRYSYVVVGGETLSNVFIENSLAPMLEETGVEMKMEAKDIKLQLMGECIYILSIEANGKKLDAREKTAVHVEQMNAMHKIFSLISTSMLVVGVLTIPLFGLGLIFLFFLAYVLLIVGSQSQKRT